MAAEGRFERTGALGHLAPTPERLERLLAKQSLEELYEVEEQPFARGKYATVRRCRERSSGKQWAAKFLKKRRRAQELKAEALHEVAVLDAAANCPRLVSLHQVFETSTEMVLVLELAPGGELQMVLDRDEIPEERQVAKLLRQILDGVAFLHSLNVAHLDIKPQNLVLTGEFPACDVKLCDFGISRYISHGADIREIMGTPDYIAPEVLNYEPISLATDMWSVGVLLYVLLTGCSPFGGDTKQETFCNISHCKLDFPDDLFEEVSEEAQDLIRRLIVKNPSERLSAVECLQHPWMNKFEDIPSLLSPFVSEPSEILEGKTVSCDNTSDFCSSTLPVTVELTSPVHKEEAPGTTCIELTAPYQEEVKEHLQSSADDLKAEPKCATVRSTKSDNEVGNSSNILSTTCPRFVDILEQMAAEPTLSSAESNEKLDVLDKPNENETTSIPCEDSNSEYRYMRRLSSPATRTPVSSTSKHHFSGLSSERRSNFKRSMDYLARKFSTSADLLEAYDDDIFDMEPSSRRSPMNTTVSSTSEVFKCTPVFILGEEQQCSDSGSDTVSEISTDSSSDRSSIYSDDSLDFILYGKTSQGRVSFPFSVSESQSWKQRNGICNSGSLRHGPRVWPRECNGVVSKALSRFTTGDHHHYHDMSSSGGGGIGSKMPIVSSSSSISSSMTLASSSAIRTSTTRSISGLEALRNRDDNLVVIREPVRAGRYMRYSEVQCESVQARIRRFQVHGSS